MGRRDSTDEKWQRLKKRVAKRDRNSCRLMKILTYQESILLFKKAPKHFLEKLDCAHVFGVGPFPHMCYIDENVVLLNRYSHECLDNCRSPITAEPISREDRDGWWRRIISEATYQSLEERAHNHDRLEDNMDEQQIKLDEKVVSQEELSEQQKRKDVRVIKIDESNYKTLQKLQE